MTDTMKLIIIVTLCAVVFFGGLIGLTGGGPGRTESQAEAVAKAARSCSNGLQAVKFHNDGTQSIERVTCK